jgi:CelD/BcsL family acetyltransferase involved in cellulose biosynthesis
MRVDIIESTVALAELRADWDRVYDADPEAHFFLSWSWLSKWLPALGSPWLVLAARPEGERSAPVAFLPLWLQTKEQNAGGFRNNLIMGGNFISDYTGILCLPEHQDQAIPALARQIKKMHWTDLRFEDLNMSRRRTDLFVSEFAKSDFNFVKLDRVQDGIDLSICPIAHLPGDWDAYLNERLSANMRQKLRRLLRQIDGSGEFRITHADGKTIDRDLDTLLRFWKVRWGAQKAKNLDGILKNLRLMTRHAFDMGSLFLPTLWHGERPICALATLIDARRKAFLFYIAGRDQTFEGPQSGLVLHAHSIRHAIRTGFATYDFLRGNEHYKYSFGVEERRIESVVLTTKSGKNLGDRLDGRSLRYVLRTSMEHHRAGRQKEAECGYRQVVEVEPYNADALYGLGQITQKRGEHAAAVKLFRTLLGAAPDTPKAWFRLGRSLQALSELSAAAMAYCEGIERQPAIAGAYSDLGKILLELVLVDDAIAAFDAARAVQADFVGLDAAMTKARRRRETLSANDVARHAARHSTLRKRIAKLKAIAALGGSHGAGENGHSTSATERGAAASP